MIDEFLEGAKLGAMAAAWFLAVGCALALIAAPVLFVIWLFF